MTYLKDGRVISGIETEGLIASVVTPEAIENNLNENEPRVSIAGFDYLAGYALKTISPADFNFIVDEARGYMLNELHINGYCDEIPGLEYYPDQGDYAVLDNNGTAEAVIRFNDLNEAIHEANALMSAMSPNELKNFNYFGGIIAVYHARDIEAGRLENSIYTGRKYPEVD